MSVSWYKVPCGEHASMPVARLLGAHEDKDFAMLGRWFVVRSILSATDTGRLDITDSATLRTLMFNLRLSSTETQSTIATFVDLGLLQMDGTEVFNIDVENSIKDYSEFVEKQKRNGKKGGRPKSKNTQVAENTS